MDENAETVILEEGNVKITNSRAIIDSKTYAFADITSVTLIKNDLAGTLQFYFNGYIPLIPSLALIPILLLGLILAILRFVFNIDYLRYFYYLCGLWWFFVIVGGFVLPGYLPPTYMIQIETRSGTSNVLKSKDKERLQKTVDAMRDVIALNLVTSSKPKP